MNDYRIYALDIWYYLITEKTKRKGLKMDIVKIHTTTDKMHDCAMDNYIYIIVDECADERFVGFCSTLDKARDLCREYSETVYGKQLYDTDNVWIDYKPLNCLIDFDEI